MTALLTRLKNLRVKPGFEVTWRHGHTLHSFDSLPVEFDPAGPPSREPDAPAPEPVTAGA
jgi:hypothetical protein